MLVGTVKQFQLYDQIIINHYHQTIESMILKAAKCIYPYVAREKYVTIIVGKGNNGADGLALAYLLKSMNTEVTICLTAHQNQLSPGAKYYYEKVQSLSIHIVEVQKEFSYEDFCQYASKSSVIVDAIFGTGLSGAPSGIEKTMIQYINAQSFAPVLSIDVPSGLNADNGTSYQEAIKAHLTISFVAMKLGFLNEEAKTYLGELRIEDLGYEKKVLNEVGFSQLLQPEAIEAVLKPRRYDGYKGIYGHLSCFVGSSSYPGAAVLSSGAALKTGAGIVQVVSEADVILQVIATYPEIVAGFDVDVAIKNANAILYGCGRGNTDDTLNELRLLLCSVKVPVLLDADGINVVANHLDLLESANCPIILTPHIGEMKRLLKDMDEKDPVLGAIAFAKKYRTIVVLKGPHTLVTDGKITVRNPSGDKAMATAGMGDALAGIIASLLAQGYTYMDACVLGTYLHGQCGQLLAQNQYVVFASDIIKEIPKLMAHLLQKNFRGQL